MASKTARKRRVAPKRRTTAAAGAPAPRKTKRPTALPSKFPALLTKTTQDGHALAPLGRQQPDEESVKWLQREAMQWTYIVQSRARWAGLAAQVEHQNERARQLVEQLGLQPQLGDLTQAHVAQVAIPYRDDQEEVGWESRILPWEFVLSAATRAQRGDQPLTVLRQLVREGARKSPAPRAPKKVLYVESTPGALAGRFSFDSERALVHTSLCTKSARGPDLLGPALEWVQLLNPTAEQLADAVKEHKPDIVHLAGFDPHQGFQVLGVTGSSARREAKDRDGYLMRDDAPNAGEPATGVRSCGPQELSGLLTQGGHRPLLVCCSLWSSAARTAPMLVAGGAHAAIGFQDSFDDGLVELFFSAFYRRYRASKWDLCSAFVSAWETLRKQPAGLAGTGLVLWSEARLIATPAAQRGKARPKARASMQELLARASSDLHPADVGVRDASKYIEVKIEAPSEINYALLHNRHPLFSMFKIIALTPQRPVGVDVRVELFAGDGGAPYRCCVDLREGKADLTNEIRIPLTSPLLRAVRETINSSIFIEVKWGEHVLARQTRFMRLLPADQWRYEDRQRSYVWLPSFVFPRDRAVASLLEKAQRYVRVLRDDPSAGFEGYQAVDPERDDPTEDVDLQVQAIWSAIVHEWQLMYTNPPPSYSSALDSQRLRTPSAVQSERLGTCIDTSLLLAACLELVEIYPVIFMLDDHAFPGYWRSSEAHDRFNTVSTAWVEAMNEANFDDARAGDTSAQGWVLGRDAYEEILSQVEEGNLVPLESTMLTESSGYWAAVDAARENFTPKRKFHSMLDIVNARSRGVTPLPLREEI